MKICVLLPDYSTTQVDYQHYDPPRNLKPLLPNDTVHTVFLNKLTTYKQLLQLSKNGYDIFVNLCEGYLEWEVPSVDVIQALETLNLPYTGPNLLLYDPPKQLMKYVAFTEGIATPAFVVVSSLADVENVMATLQFPMFAKPAKAGDSLGIDDASLIHNQQQLQQKIANLLLDYNSILVEEYIDGREFTVLVAANPLPDINCSVYQPIEYLFPEGNCFKTYALKTSELHPTANVAVADEALDASLRLASQHIFKAFNGVGYARLDFRTNEKGKLFFLEINFTCSVFYENNYQGSADYILLHDGIGPSNFLQQIIAEGIARHGALQPKYTIKGNAIAGFGIYAANNLHQGAIVFKGEEKAQRIVTRRFVHENWNEKEKENFRRYAYPLSQQVYILWDENPANWAPQNHSCNANTVYDGLNVVAAKNIAKDEELTLDYALFLDETMMPFLCSCGAGNCRGIIQGQKNNSIGNSEALLF